MAAPNRRPSATVNPSPSQPALPGLRKLAAHPAAYIVAVSVGSALLALFFFCPRFVMFQGLNYSAAWHNPEVIRAIDTLKQLDDPFVEITSPANLVLNWRLLFPLVGHYLRLPPGLFLALPYLGCLCTLALLAHVSRRELGNRWDAALLTAALATSAWFFVSTGWLAYFDSWYMLGMVATVGLRSRWAIAAATLLAPWIDERFLIALPLCLALRTYLFVPVGQGMLRSLAGDVGVAAAAAAPYLACRLMAFYGRADSGTSAYLNHTFSTAVPASRYLYGAWAGLRMLWLLVAAFYWQSFRASTWRWSMLVAAGSLFTFLVCVTIAGDIHRSVAVFVPAAWTGAVLWGRYQPHRLRAILTAVLVANLLLPAAHVVSIFQGPIRYLYAEVDHYRRPPDYLTPGYYNGIGVELQRRQLSTEALDAFALALRLDPQFAPAHLERGVVLLSQQKYAQASVSLSAAIRFSPSRSLSADAHYLRGVCGEMTESFPLAANDYETALALAPSDWTHRADCSARLARLRQR